ncbi:probable methyltransferase PMT23 [Selaginella moellendorffii]|nr:probable methyltransferase PMT23 [Selaginella moellendorffii]|eukprot:XP_024525803.1 probable methyltransferase PMT23 [Selaginella moellendorffii]
MRVAKPMRDRRKTPMYYLITGVFAAILILAAIAFFRSPSEQGTEVVPQTNEAASQMGSRENSPSEAREGEVTKESEKESDFEQEMDATEEKNLEDKQQADHEKDGDKVDGEKKDDTPVDNGEQKKDSDAPDEDKGEEKKVEDKEEEKKDEETQSKDATEKKDDSDTATIEELGTNKTELELTVENKEVSNTWTSQANESKQEMKKEDVLPSADQQTEKKPEEKQPEQSPIDMEWKLCSFSNAADYIPCLDNQKAIKKLRSRSHYEHRERHCPTGDDIKKCLAPLPSGYQAHVNWPQSRKQVWYSNVPHPGLVSYKKDQNWVKKKDDLLLFPGGGTQFKQGAQRYIDFIQISLPDIAWGKHVRTVLDVGCGVASFGGFLFDKNVITMSFAPKDEHEAQVQLALERGIPAILAVMGTQRLVYPSYAYDIAHCARCRVPWHVDGGRLLLELNRLIRPGGYFVWSATPVYKNEPEDVQIWKDTKALADNMCWKMIVKQRDPKTGVGIAIFQKPKDNTCYQKRQKNEPPMCDESDNRDAAWYVPMQSCLHKIPEGDGIRGTRWPQEWPQRVNATPDWLGTIPKGLFGKPAVEEFESDTIHWQHVVQKSYARGLEIDWTVIRNVMDMKAGYGGFAAALVGYPVWVLNVVPVTEPDTLPIITDRGLIGQYHDWCESFSTYPRTYDLLHADHLFSRLKQSCGVVNTVVEMDRILRPGGWGIFRDTTTILGEIEPLLKSLHWEIRVSYTQEQEQLIAAQKTSWRPSS